jgi:hypothetical protein
MGNLLPDDWQELAGLPPGTDRLLDPDFDGVATWLEYYLGADPLNFRATDLTTPEIRVNPADNRRYLEYRYSRRVGSMEVEEFVELSEALGAWEEHPERLEAVSAPVPNADGVTETVRLRLLPSLDDPGAEPRAYLRLGLRLRP